jgi:hypothetical protein
MLVVLMVVVVVVVVCGYCQEAGKQIGGSWKNKLRIV